MTKRQRAQVVELLRCAADLYMTGHFGALTQANGDSTGTAYHEARRAFEATYTDGGCELDYLEAAARVEEGEWP